MSKYAVVHQIMGYYSALKEMSYQARKRHINAVILLSKRNPSEKATYSMTPAI